MAKLIERAKKPASADPNAEQAAAKAAAAAPDSRVKSKADGKPEMFGVGLAPDFMAEVDAFRARHGLSRPALVRLALRKILETGV